MEMKWIINVILLSVVMNLALNLSAKPLKEPDKIFVQEMLQSKNANWELKIVKDAKKAHMEITSTREQNKVVWRTDDKDITPEARMELQIHNDGNLILHTYNNGKTDGIWASGSVVDPAKIVADNHYHAVLTEDGFLSIDDEKAKVSIWKSPAHK